MNRHHWPSFWRGALCAAVALFVASCPSPTKGEIRGALDVLGTAIGP